MSQENIDLVRSICAAWDRGDYSSADWADPEIEFAFRDGPEPSSGTGATGFREAWRTWLDAWEEFHQEAAEYREVDNERVLVFFRFSGRGKTSGLELEQMHSKAAGLFQVRDG